jgi:hypothetical protein
LSATEGARTPLYLATSDDVVSVSGRYFVECEPVEVSDVARDAAAARRLWDVSEQLVAGALAAAR